MRSTLRAALLAGVLFPVAAFAQTTPTEPQTPPAAETPAEPPAPPEPATTPDAPAPADAPPAGEAAAPADEPMEDAAAPAESMPMDDAAASASADMAGTEGPFVTVPPTGAWRSTDLDGKDVYDAAGENIGSITDVLVAEEGEVIAVLVGVGGFLGIGQKDVAVAMTALEFGPGKTEGLPTEASMETADTGTATAPVDPSAPPAAGGEMAAGGTATEPETPVVGEDNLPDRIVLNVSREQLESAPAYGETEDAAAETPAATGMSGGMTPAPAQ